MATYDAFISYSHAKDKSIASALQSTIQMLGKPWYRRRSTRLFRDDTSLAATPELWNTIQQALSQSRFFILLASPEAASSKWVSKEVSYWLDHNPVTTILIGLTGGDLAWDEISSEFVSPHELPLPSVLRGRFPTEPKWVDLRRHRENPDTKSAQLIEAGANFAAAIRGIPKEDLLSQEVRQQRRALGLAYSAVGSLAVLMALAAWQWQVAVSQRDLAEQTLDVATDTANNLIFDLADRFKNTVGIPATLVGDLLDRARKLQDDLTAGTSMSSPALRQRINTLNPELRYRSALALMSLQDTLVRQGDTTAALSAAKKGQGILEDIVKRDPSNLKWQEELSAAYGKIADVLMRQGSFTESLAFHARRLAIREQLAKAHPEDSDKQFYLAISHMFYGDALEEAGQVDSAVTAHARGLIIIEAQAQRKPNDRIWQQYLGVAYYSSARTHLTSAENADAQERKSQSAESLNYLWKSLAIRQALRELDPDNSDYLDELASTYIKIGQALHVSERYSEARLALDEGLMIISQLIRADESNAIWVNYLAEVQTAIGDVLKADQKPVEASVAYATGLAALEQLAALDPDNVEWQRELAILLVKAAAVDFDSKKKLERAHSMLKKLGDDGRGSPAQRRWMDMAETALAASGTSN